MCRRGEQVSYVGDVLRSRCRDGAILQPCRYQAPTPSAPTRNGPDNGPDKGRGQPVTVERPTWSVPRRPPELKSGEIHLWRAELNSEAMNALPSLVQTLSADELARAGRFHLERDRNRYVLARGALRSILARYLKTTPGEPAFLYGPSGKPELANGVVCFNLSHADDLVLYAISRAGHVGVDIERVRPGVEKDLAARLSPTARRLLEALAPAARRRAFFQGWTRMEAYAKARGEGVESGLETFETFLGDQPPHWQLHDFSPRRGYVGALATRRGKCRLEYWKWQGDQMVAV
jgi:4'-phosphopantetheinyl transferase